VARPTAGQSSQVVAHADEHGNGAGGPTNGYGLVDNDRARVYAANAAALAVRNGTPNEPGPWVNAPNVEPSHDRVARMRDVEAPAAQPEPTTVYVDTSVVGPGRYRTAQTVTIGSQTDYSPVRRPTISLGTTGGDTGSYDTGYVAPAAAAPSIPASVPSVASGGYTPPPTMPPAYHSGPTPAAYAPAGYAQPAYGGAAPSYGGIAPAFAAPAHVGYAAPSAPAAVAAPSYGGPNYGVASAVRAPSYSAPVNAGGSFAPVHTAAPVHMAAPVAPAMAAPPSVGPVVAGPGIGSHFRR
jgi:hypothetical protein